VLPGL
jgi:transposase